MAMRRRHGPDWVIVLVRHANPYRFEPVIVAVPRPAYGMMAIGCRPPMGISSHTASCQVLVKLSTTVLARGGSVHTLLARLRGSCGGRGRGNFRLGG